MTRRANEYGGIRSVNFTADEIKYIIEHNERSSSREIAEALGATPKQIENFRRWNKGKIPKVDRHITTKEQDAYIAEINAGRSAADVTRMVNEKFGTNFTAEQIKGYRSRHHLDSGLTGRFEKGQSPWNKGIHYVAGGRSAETRFKKGQMPHTWRPVGSTRITVDGYKEIKVAEPRKWRPYQNVVWEKAHGEKLKKGMKVIFADGDKMNFDPDNLLAVTFAEVAVMNRMGLIVQGSGDATKAGLEVARLLQAGARAKRKLRGWSFAADKQFEEADRQHEIDMRNKKAEERKSAAVKEAEV